MRAIVQLGVIAVLAAAAAGVTWRVKGPPQRQLVCDPAGLKEDEVCLADVPRDGSVLWIDARLRREWEADGLEGSVLWNLDPAEDMQAFEAQVFERLVACGRVVVYCGDENCGTSRQIAGRIRALGLGKPVAVLYGGSRALREAGWMRGRAASGG